MAATPASASHKVREVLSRCSLVVYQTRSISPERDTGNTVKKGAKTIKETVRTFDPAILKAMHAEKQRGGRLCQQYGTKVESMAAWLVPNDRLDELVGKLTEVQERVSKLTEELSRNIGQHVEAFAVRNPDHADQIRALGPTAVDVTNGIKILYAAYRLRPEDVTDGGGLTEDLQSLHMQALHEFNMALRDAKVEPYGKTYSVNTRAVLSRISVKAKSLAFLHPVLQDVSDTLEECLKGMPVTGRVEGLYAVSISSLISQMMQPQELARNGGFRKLQAVQDGNAGQGAAPPASPSSDDSNDAFSW